MIHQLQNVDDGCCRSAQLEVLPFASAVARIEPAKPAPMIATSTLFFICFHRFDQIESGLRFTRCFLQAC